MLNTGNRQSITQAFFKILYDYFSTHPNYTVIALQYGATVQLPGSPAGSSGTGTGFYDQINSFGYNSFFVVRANATNARPFDVYHLFQWGGSINQVGNSFGSAPGNPGLVRGSNSPINNNFTYLGHAAAIGIGGTGGSPKSPGNGNPWKGTTAANGTDTKAASGPVWAAPAGGGSGVIIFPRSNDGVSGAHRTLAQNTGDIFAYTTDAGGQVRLSIVGDDDSFAIAADYSDDGRYTLAYSGLYTVRNGLTAPYPYCVIDTDSYLPWSVTDQSTYGDIAGTSTQQGGVVQAVSGTCAQLQLDHYSNFATDTNFWPDHSFATTTYNELDIPIGIYEPTPTQVSGFLGQIDFVREMYNVLTNGVKSDYSRIFLGLTVLQDRKYSIPWDSQNLTAPRSGTSRAGVTFVGTFT